MSHSLPDNIRWFRRARDLSQQELAELCGFKQQYVSALERGLRPSEPRHVDVLATALGMSRATLLRRRRFVRYASTSGKKTKRANHHILWLASLPLVARGRPPPHFR